MTRNELRPPRRWMLDHTSVAIWGVGRWGSAYCWGRGDPQREPLTGDPYDGTAHWGQHCWATDFWLSW
jgi:hypothetical protein